MAFTGKGWERGVMAKKRPIDKKVNYTYNGFLEKKKKIRERERDRECYFQEKEKALKAHESSHSQNHVLS